MSVFEAVAVPRLYRVIADQIASKIQQGEFSVGSRLPSERELAEQLQVSRASIREALIALELEGYVAVRVGTGVFVISDQQRNLNHSNDVSQPAQVDNDFGPFGLLETRLLLEPESAELAAALATEEQLQAIQAAYESMEGSATPAREDRAFHMAIAAACGNSALAATIAHVWELALHSPMFSRMERHFVDANVWEKAQLEHGRILDAIKSRDKVRARSAMHDHLVSILARLRVDFGNEGIG